MSEEEFRKTVIGRIPEGWEWKKLGDVAEFINGRAFKPSEWEENGKMIIRIQDLTGSISDPHFTTETFEERYLVSKGDLLVSWSATLDVFIWEKEAGWLNQHIFKVNENARIIDRQFLHYLISQKIETMKSQTHGSTMKHITKGRFVSIPIPLPPLPVQKKIVSILDRADRTRRLHTEVEGYIDEFLKSVFIEMFGDPVTNPKGWDKERFGDVCDSRLGKMLDEKQQTGMHNRQYLRNSNVQWWKLILDDMAEMDFNANARKKFQLLKGDILICEGGEVGRAAIWNDDLPECYFQKALHRARPKQNKLTPEYLVALLWFLSKYGGLGGHTSKVTIAHLTGVKLKSLLIPIPPIELQQLFKEVLKKSEHLRNKNIQSSRETNDLFNALMQKAFRGELT